jgi:hypothetical protein
MNNPEVVAAIVSAIGAVGAAVVAGLGMIFKKVENFLLELKPNGGGSIKDQVTRLEAQHQKLENKVDKLYELMIDKLGK